MKLAVTLGVVLSLCAGATDAALAGPALPAPAGGDLGVTPVDYFSFGYGTGRPYYGPGPYFGPRAYYGPRPYYPPRPAVRVWPPRRAYYGGPCATRVVRQTWRGPVVTVYNRCRPYY